MTPSDLIHYFKDCYDADNRRGTIWNVFHRDVAHRIFLDGDEDLLSGSFPMVSVDEELGRAASKSAYLSRKERELLYCSLLVVGSISMGDEGVRKVCAPLLMHPAKIEEENGHLFLMPDWEERRINHRLLSAIMEEETMERVVDLLRSRYVSIGEMGELIGALQGSGSGIDCSTLYSYPKILSEKEVRELASADNGNNQLAVLSAALVGLFKKSVETRGILNELAEMSGDVPLSSPMRALLLGEDQAVQDGKYVGGYVPAVLSRAQERVLRSAATRPLTLVIGPPGTGKSYTIAALAMEHVSRGESVLIASRMNHAVDVVGNKIEKQLNVRGCVVRGGRKNYLSELKSYLQELLSGIRDVEVSTSEIQRLKNEMDHLYRSIRTAEKSIVKRCDIEQRRGTVLSSDSRSPVVRLRSWYIRWRVGREVPVAQTLHDLERLLARKVVTAARFVEKINRLRTMRILKSHRMELLRFLNALRARSGLRQEELFRTIDFRILFQALPVWLVNLSDIHNVLPLSRELFDLAIIDEATQCDVASCLPIFQRAKRVVVVGDPNQLRHLSFLSRNHQRMLMEKHGIPLDAAGMYDYREKSILDVVNDRMTRQEHVIFLNEHYRSVPSIIGFSNETFYGGALHIMAERPGESSDDGVYVEACEGEQTPLGENPVEAQAIVRQVLHYVGQSERRSASGTVPTIGILSPFRRQVDYITDCLSRALPMSVFEQHEIMIGTPYTFQGEERDIMLLSLAVDDRSHSARIRFINRPDAFNVAVTRARRIQHLYRSFVGRRSDDSLLGRYLRFVVDRSSIPPTTNAGLLGQEDSYMSEVAEELVRRNLSVHPACRIAGSTVDLLVEHSGVFCGVDLVGFPGRLSDPLPLERYLMFYRVGLRILPLPYTEWLLNRDEFLGSVERLLRVPDARGSSDLLGSE